MGDKTLREMLSPIKCAILSIPPEYRFRLLVWWSLLQQWTLYNRTRLKAHYHNYKLLKDVLHHPRQKDIGQPIKLRCGPFLETALGHIILLQTPEKDAWTIFDLMEQQDVLADSQLLTVEVKPSDYSCHFFFVGPPKPNTLFILKEGIHFHGIKDLITFFENYCHFHCCC